MEDCINKKCHAFDETVALNCGDVFKTTMNCDDYLITETDDGAEVACSDLLPCPFCGGKDIRVFVDGITKIGCMGCTATIQLGVRSVVKNKEAWNTRQAG